MGYYNNLPTEQNCIFWQGNLFAGFDETFFARAEALAAVDYPGKNQFKTEATNYNYYTSTVPHYASNQHIPSSAIPTPGKVKIRATNSIP